MIVLIVRSREHHRDRYHRLIASIVRVSSLLIVVIVRWREHCLDRLMRSYESPRVNLRDRSLARTSCSLIIIVIESMAHATIAGSNVIIIAIKALVRLSSQRVRDHRRDRTSSFVPTRCSSRSDRLATGSQIVARRSSCSVGSSTLVQRIFHHFSSATQRLEVRDRTSSFVRTRYLTRLDGAVDCYVT